MIKKQLAVLFLMLAASPAGAWWNCSWDYRFPATIAKPPGAPLTDYQVRMNLNALNVPAQFNWSLMGADLRAVAQKDVTLLDHFIEQWNVAGQTAVVWVRVPSIPVADANGTDLTVTNMRIHPKNTFRGNSGAGAPQADFAFKLVVQ